jgi:hypothetical protein
MTLKPDDVAVLRAVRDTVGRCGVLSKQARMSYSDTDTTLQRLKHGGLIVYMRGRGSHWEITRAGRATLKDIEDAR